MFIGLAQLDSTRALALTNCVCLVPAILLALSRKKEDKYLWLKLGMDVFAILAQLSGALVWPIMDVAGPGTMEFPWAIPVGLVLTSFGWWECYVEEKSQVIIWTIDLSRPAVLKPKIRGSTNFLYWVWANSYACLFFYPSMD